LAQATAPISLHNQGVALGHARKTSSGNEL